VGLVFPEFYQAVTNRKKVC